ncbi:hypothetical protein EVAR_19251_1 [Eumeta japonica]|uniref:Uncharacterized protein n=1 Tax=Eumeta variegata TaxID=151549 RepID=A0A4C1UE32_EUMVA|nr:hypothetical protein EVAR_19251_1 [Eumeta japonica]
MHVKVTAYLLKKGQILSTRKRRAYAERSMDVDEARNICNDRPLKIGGMCLLFWKIDDELITITMMVVDAQTDESELYNASAAARLAEGEAHNKRNLIYGTAYIARGEDLHAPRRLGREPIL